MLGVKRNLLLVEGIGAVCEVSMSSSLFSVVSFLEEGAKYRLNHDVASIGRSRAVTGEPKPILRQQRQIKQKDGNRVGFTAIREKEKKQEGTVDK